MATIRYRTKFGVVIVLDALGASTFSPAQIKTFLSARSTVNDIVKSFAKSTQKRYRFSNPEIFTFGDTLVITVAIKKNRSISGQLLFAVTLMRRYMFHAMTHGLLFRGAFAIGNYIEEAESNTVMGEAVADAAEWYDRADWAGICATPKSCTQIEFHTYGKSSVGPAFLVPYSVPLKGGITQQLYCVSWPGAFFDGMLRKLSSEPTPRQAFLALVKDMSYPATAASKYDNMKTFFSHVEEKLAESLRAPPMSADS